MDFSITLTKAYNVFINQPTGKNNKFIEWGLENKFLLNLDDLYISLISCSKDLFSKMKNTNLFNM